MIQIKFLCFNVISFGVSVLAVYIPNTYVNCIYLYKIYNEIGFTHVQNCYLACFFFSLSSSEYDVSYNEPILEQRFVYVTEL